MDRRKAARAALALLAAHNVAQNTILHERGYVPGNIVVSGSLLGLARASGLSWDELGLRPGPLRQQLRVGAWSLAMGVAVSALLLTRGTTRRYLRDQRSADTSWRVILGKTLVRFPVGTALFEEIAFRGVLPPLLGRGDRHWTGDLWSAAAFAAWHIVPAGHALAGNPIGEGAGRAGFGMAVAGGSVLAGAAGVALAAVRRAHGNLVGPWLAHSAFNSVTYLAGVIAWRLDASGGRLRPIPPRR